MITVSIKLRTNKLTNDLSVHHMITVSIKLRTNKLTNDLSVHHISTQQQSLAPTAHDSFNLVKNVIRTDGTVMNPVDITNN